MALRRPEAAFVSQEAVSGQWRGLNYHDEPDFAAACAEFDRFEEIINSTGCRITRLGPQDGLGLDSLYVRDSLIVTPRGIIKAGMGKKARRGEPETNAAMLAEAGETIIGAISAPGKVEGGDLVWLDENTLLAGVGYRTNSAGLDQLQALAGDEVTIHRFDMPHFKGPGDVFHLMSVLSPVDRDLAVVFPPLMPVRLMELLLLRGFRLVEVPDEEFETMACNILAIAPRHVVMVDKNPVTAQLLRDAGCKVEIIKADEISRKGEGGPTCLARPLARS